MVLSATPHVFTPKNNNRDSSFSFVIFLSIVFHLIVFVGIPVFAKLMYHPKRFDRPKTFTLVRMAPIQPQQAKEAPIVQPKVATTQPKPKSATTPVPKKHTEKQMSKKEENSDDLNELLSAIPTTKVSDMSVSRDFKFNWYTQNMQSRIEENFKPPMGLTDKSDVAVIVSYTVFENGSISDVSIVQSSGISTLDNCAIKAVKDSAPFGKLPLSFPDKKLEPTVTLYYVKKQD